MIGDRRGVRRGRRRHRLGRRSTPRASAAATPRTACCSSRCSSGSAIGMGAAPQLARRLPHNRLFGAAIVAAGLALVLVALAPHLFVALGAVALVGGFAGDRVPHRLDDHRLAGRRRRPRPHHRVRAVDRAARPCSARWRWCRCWSAWCSARTVHVLGHPFLIDGTRVVMLAGGIVAARVGMIAYRQMDDRRIEPMLPDLLAALRRGDRRDGAGVLIAVEGAPAEETAEQAHLLAGAAARGGAPRRRAGRRPARPRPLDGRDARGRAERGPGEGARRRGGARRPGGAGHPSRARRGSGRRRGPVRGQPAGPVRRGRRPCRPISTPASWRASPAGRPGGCARTSRCCSTGPQRRRRDTTGPAAMPGEEHVRVQRLLTRMAAAEPHRYVVVDADGSADEVAERVFDGLEPVLPGPPRRRTMFRRGPDPRALAAREPSMSVWERGRRAAGGRRRAVSAAAADPDRRMTHAWLFTGPARDPVARWPPARSPPRCSARRPAAATCPACRTVAGRHPRRRPARSSRRGCRSRSPRCAPGAARRPPPGDRPLPGRWSSPTPTGSPRARPTPCSRSSRSRRRGRSSCCAPRPTTPTTCR